jgi:uncharacterized hydrophobic protein (TIGR00271 family)
MAELLHLRLVVPAARRDAVLRALDQMEAACNVSVLADAARRPAGDVVELDVPREVINALLDELENLRVHEDGSIAVIHNDLALSRFADDVQEAMSGEPYDTVVWEEVSAKLRSAAQPTVAFLAFFAVAAIIATGGVLSDSPILIVGAMVVGPEYAPLAAMAAGLRDHDGALVRQGATALGIGAALAVAVAAVLALLARAIDQVPLPYAVDDRPLTSFITEPDLFTVLIAAAAAVAGMLALAQDRAGTLVGVLISVTTIPAIAEVGVGLAFGKLDDVGGALLQLAINVTCIVLIGALTLALLHRNDRPARRSGPHEIQPRGDGLGYLVHRHGAVPPSVRSGRARTDESRRGGAARSDRRA